MPEFENVCDECEVGNHTACTKHTKAGVGVCDCPCPTASEHRKRFAPRG
jgi:hypothetical protein